MHKPIFSLIFLLLCNVLLGQVRITALAGPVLPLNDKKQDTAFFSDQGFQGQVKVGFYKGRLGLVLGGEFLQQKPGSVIEDGRLPKIALTQAQGAIDSSLVFSGGNINTTLFTFAPQLCFPLKKIKIHLSIGGGLAFVKADNANVAIKSNFNPGEKNIYFNEAEEGSVPVITGGINFQIPIYKMFSLDLNTEYISYKIGYINKDRRNGLVANQREDKKQLLAIKGGFTFKF